MEKVYEEAFTEVDAILKLMPIDLISKIPTQFRQVISENKSANYIVNIQEPLDKQNLKKETIAILGLIYRDFLASPEKKEMLQKKDAEEIEKIREQEEEEYNIDKAFKRRKEKKNENEIYDDQVISDVNAMIIYRKKNMFTRLFDKIRRFFNKS